jgi:5-methylcytosine-specific restriction enzyme B
MAIPPVPAEALREAMERFDRELRPTANWVNWEQDRRHRYAIEHDGRRYPVKQIISMATRMRVRDFGGGSEPGDANRYVTSRGFAIVRLR